MPRNLIFHEINALALNGFCIDEFGLAVFGCAYFIESVKYLLHVVSVDIIDLKAEGCRLCAQVDMRHDLIAGTIELETIIIYHHDEIVKLISICTHHCFPDYALVHLAVAEEREHAIVLMVALTCKSHADSTRSSLPEREPVEISMPGHLSMLG